MYYIFGTQDDGDMVNNSKNINLRMAMNTHIPK